MSTAAARAIVEQRGLADGELLDRFDRRAIPHAAWMHETHLRVAHAILRRERSRSAAMAALRTSIRLLNAAHGTPNTDDRGYHETITWAWVCVVDAAMAAGPPEETALEMLAREPTLLTRDRLLRHYSRAHLFSVASRRGLVEADREPLPT